MKNSCPQWDSNQGPSAYVANALLELINIDHLKVTAFYLSFLCKLSVPRTRSLGFTCAIFINFVVYFSHIFVSFCCLIYFRRLLTVKSY